MTVGPAEDQMGSIRFVLLMLGLAGGFMAARHAVPHWIDGISVYVAVSLVVLAACGAVVGLARG